MSNTSSKSNTRRLAEGGICIALALVLSYIKIPIGLSFGGFGGSITLVMVPLILFAVRYGAPWGILAGVAVYGVLVIALGLLRADDVRNIRGGQKLIRLLHLR